MASLKFLPTILAPRVWATAVNYPAGPNAWNGSAVKSDPIANEITPDEHPAAEELNFLFHDRYARLTEARADLLRIHQMAQATSIASANPVSEEIRGLAVTAKGRAFRVANAGGALDFVAVSTFGRLFEFVTLPSLGGNNDPMFACANGEKVLYGDSPDSFIYDADARTFSGAVASGANICLAAIPNGTGWLTLWVDSLSFGAAVANVSGPRQFAARPAQSFQIRTVSSAGAVGADTGATVAAAMAPFTALDPMMVYLVRGASDSIAFLLVSGATGSKRNAYYSADGGATWTARATPDPYAGNDTSWAIEWCTLSARFILCVSRGSRSFVYWSVDGAAWTQLGAEYVLTAGSPAKGSFAPFDILRLESGVLVTLSFSRAAVGGVPYHPVHASVDGGASWAIVGELANPGGVGRLSFAMTSGAPFIVTGGAGHFSYYSDAKLFAFGDDR